MSCERGRSDVERLLAGGELDRVAPSAQVAARLLERKQHLPALARCENVVLKIGALIRPLSGERWDRSGGAATSAEIAAAWGDEIHFAIRQFGPSRCLFESNFPVDKACYGYVEIWNAFR